LFRTYDTDQEKILLAINTEEVLLPIETAIPCALIINELLSNSLKYAFQESGNGIIRIELKRIEQGIKILFEDDGPGFPGNMDSPNTGSLGLELINLLIEQLKGKIEFFGTGGAKYLLTLQA